MSDPVPFKPSVVAGRHVQRSYPPPDERMVAFLEILLHHAKIGRVQAAAIGFVEHDLERSPECEIDMGTWFCMGDMPYRSKLLAASLVVENRVLEYFRSEDNIIQQSVENVVKNNKDIVRETDKPESE